VLAFAFVVVDPKDGRGAGFYEKYGFKKLESAQQRMYLDIRNLQKTLGVYA
jgi:ribosomal protein S18 acetylase RimI-like enzyme